MTWYLGKDKIKIYIGSQKYNLKLAPIIILESKLTTPDNYILQDINELFLIPKVLEEDENNYATDI